MNAADWEDLFSRTWRLSRAGKARVVQLLNPPVRYSCHWNPQQGRWQAIHLGTKLSAEMQAEAKKHRRTAEFIATDELRWKKVLS